MSNTRSNKKDEKSKSLEQKILSIIQLLHPYVKRRLRMGENLGILPRNMYRSNEIIDDVILNVYEDKVKSDIDIYQLRLMMFTKTNNKMFDLFENEKWHKDTISTKILLEKELRLLEEKFTIDADFDFIMNEELDDISYHQNKGEPHLLQSDEIQQNVVDFLELKENIFYDNEENQDTLRKMYRNLPLQTSNVMDLYVLGKLNYQEISTILDADIVEIKKIIGFVKENFRKHFL
ncbi:MAG: hypothetical protein ABFR32_06655 [Bacteroidota bacterium]